MREGWTAADTALLERVLRYDHRVHADPFDEEEFFGALARSGGRVLLIGRRALIAHGLPVLTADYDLWIHIDDIERLNAAVVDLDLAPNRAPEEARALGRYVLENHVRVDVLVARRVSTKDGQAVAFDEVWERHEELVYESAVTIAIPTIDDLILTKRWAMRDKDIADIRLLETLKRTRGGDM
jgi:hypothetical protein